MLAKELARLNVDEMTPLEALKTIAELKKKIDNSQG
jgi:hypothetical protein